jgi:hypothetical protein
LFEVSFRETRREKKAEGEAEVDCDVTVIRRANAPAGTVETGVVVELDDARQKSFQLLVQGEFRVNEAKP